MPSTVNTYGDISPRTAAWAAKQLLERGQPMAMLERFGYFDPQGKNKTKTRKWRRYEALSPATSPLVEGVTPAGNQIRYTDVEATLQQYGDYVTLTDVIADTHEDPVLSEHVGIMSEQIVETVELVRYAVLKAGTNVFYAAGVTSRTAVASAPTRGDLRKIYRAFKRNRAKEFTKIIKASANVATEPVGRSYFILGHTDLDSDLRGISGFVPVEKYSDAMKAMEGEIGKIENFRILLSDLFEPFQAAATDASSQTTFLTGGVAGTGSADVYPMLALAQNAYAIVPLQGMNAVKPMVKNPGEPVQGDELGQRGFVSWKMYQTTAILNELWMARYEVAATANPS